MSQRLIEKLIERANNSPNEMVLRQIQTGRTVSWKELERRTAAVARYLSQRLPVGTVVLLSGGNQPEFVAGFLGILRSGCKAFAIAPGLARGELREAAELSKARAIIASQETIQTLAMDIPSIVLDQIDGLADAGGEDADRDLSQTALLLISSGTTGRSKVVHRNAGAIDAVIDAIIGAVGFSESDRVFVAIPLSHSYGIEHGLLAPLGAGSKVTLAEGLDLAAILKELRGGTTIFPGVPSILEMLAYASDEKDGSFASLRRVYSAGAPLPQTVAEKFAAQFGLVIGQIYGTTEAGTCTFSDPEDPDFNPASVGRPARGTVVAILDPDESGVGEIAIRSTSMFDGYLGEPAIVTDGFFHTGDLGWLDGRGNLLITGRIKLLIDVGGKKVNPLEVEQALAEHPEVAECVVLPVQLSATVTRLRALVQPRDSGRVPSVTDLRRHLRDRLSPHKVPRVIEFRDSFPRSATGKILRQKLQG